MTSTPDPDRNYQPTLFVGLGEAGFRWLELVGQQLDGESRRMVRTLGIRMAGGQVDANHPESRNPYIDQIIKMDWDQQGAALQAAATPAYRWWQAAWNEAASSEMSSARLEARMAFHTMQYFNQDPRLDNFLNDLRANLPQGNTILLFILTSSSEPDSAYLGDLVNKILHTLGTEYVSVCLPCCLIPGDDEHKNDLIAFLRELERFTRPDQIIEAGGDNLLLDHELFNHILFLDKSDYLRPLADQLIALTNPNTAVAFKGAYTNFPKPDVFSMLVSRSFAFSIPIVELRNLCATRLVKEELLRPFYFESITNDINNFFRIDAENRADHWRFFQLMSQVINNHQLQPEEKNYIKNWQIDPDVLNLRLAEHFNKFSGTPGDLLNFLKQLDDVIDDGFDNLNAYKPGLREARPRFRAVITCYRKELDKWDKNLTSLRTLADKYYGELNKKLNNQIQDQVFQKKFFQEYENSQLGLETGYYDSLKAGNGWNELVTKVRSSLVWRWSLSERDHTPAVRCTIGGEAFTSPQQMLHPLCSQVFDLTFRLAVQDSIFDFLNRWGAADIRAKFDGAEKLLSYTALPSLARRQLKLLTGPSDPILQEWRLDPLISHCESPQKKRLVYTVFDFNLPISGSAFMQNLNISIAKKDPYLANSSSSYAFPHEQNAAYFEHKFRLSTSLPAALVRLMHDRGRFENAMWCVFYNWIAEDAEIGNSTTWHIKLDGNPSFPLTVNNQRPLTLEDALVIMLLKLPFLDTGGLSPFSPRNNEATHAEISRLVIVERRRASEEMRTIYENLEQRILNWQSMNNPFYKGLAGYQQALLALQSKRRTPAHYRKTTNEA